MRLTILEVKLHFRSGKTLTAWVDYITTKANDRNELIDLSWSGGKLPMYHRLEAIEAVTYRTVINWRRCFL